MKKVFGFIAFGFLLWASSSFAGPGAGTNAPNFTLPDTNGINYSLTDFSGKVVLLNFWDVD